MKTSKRLLSFFLAVVMVVTACSVGFTAFAAEPQQDKVFTYINNEGEATTVTYASLNAMVDKYLPALVGGALRGTLEGIGVNVDAVIDADGADDDGLVYELLSQLSPTLIGLLGGSASAQSVLGSDYNSTSDFYYSYLEDDDAAMNFWSLYKFCSDNQDSGNADIKAFCTATLPQLQALLDQKANGQADEAAAFSAADTKIRALLGDALIYEDDLKVIINNSLAADAEATVAAQDIGTAYSAFGFDGMGFIPAVPETVGDVILTNGNTLGTQGSSADGVDLNPFIDRISALAAASNIIGEGEKLTLAQACFYYYTDNITNNIGALVALATSGGETINVHDDMIGDYTVSQGEYFVDQLFTGFTFDAFAAFFGDTGVTVNDNAYWRAVWRTFPVIFSLGMPSDSVQQSRDAAVNAKWYSDAATTTLVYLGIYEDSNAVEVAKNDSKLSDSDFAAIKERLLKLGALTNPNAPEVGATGVNNDKFFNGNTVGNKSVESLLNSYSFSDRVKHALFMSNPSTSVIQALASDLINWSEGDAWTSNMQSFANTCDKYFFSYEVNCGLNGIAVNLARDYNVVDAYVNAVIYKTAVAANLNHYEWDNYKPDDALALSIVNAMINGLLNTYLSPGTMIGDGISGALAELLSINIDLKEELTDIYINLANQPVETIFKLLPILVALIDEIVVPIVFNAAGDGADIKDDAYYNARTHGILMELLGGSLLKNMTQAANSTVGIGTLEWDLNYVVPAALHWLNGDNDYTYTYYDVTETTDADGRDIVIYNGTVTGKFGTKYDADGNKTYLIPCILNIYAVDKLLAGAAISDLEGKFKGDTGKILKEVLTDISGLATGVVDDYVANHQYDIKAYTSDGETPANKGMNNIFVALPKIIDGIGKEFASRNSIPTEWYFGVYGTNAAGYDSNKTLEDFKQLASDKASAEEILDSFVNIFINNWLNALLSLLNDVISTDNFITTNLPIVAALLNAVDLFGEKSALTDILNGLFGLTRNDLCSFTMEERDNGYVGFSTMSAYFLLTNVDKVVEIVMSIVEANKSDDSDGDSYGAGTFAPYAIGDTVSSITSMVDIDRIMEDAQKVATEKNVAAANNLIDKLDAVLSALLKNTYVDGFAIDHTDGILSAVVTFVTNHLGEDLTNELADLLVQYLRVINAENTKDGGTWNKNSGKDNCQIDYKAVYSKKNLSILVSNTYALVEKIVNQKLNIKGDEYGVINGAINGIYSPSAVAVRSDNVDDKIMKCLTWQDASTQYGTDLGYGNLSAGDKDVFYQDLFESLSIIPGIVGALLGTTGYYNTVISPILGAICDTAGVDYTKTVADDASGVDIMIAIKDAVSGILAQIIETPLSTIMNSVKGAIGLLDDASVSSLIAAAIAPIFAEIGGLINVLKARLSPTLADKISQAAWNFISQYISGAPTENIVITLINNALGTEFPPIDFAAIAQEDNGVILLALYVFAIDVITDSNVLQSLLGENNSKLVNLLSTLDADKVLNMLADILSITQNPTEIYWTFSQYVEQETNSFSYPKGITAQDAEDAVDRLDEVVAAVFPLLQQFDVLDAESLKALVDEKLFTNEIITKIAVAVYGGIDNSGALSFSPAKFATYLTDSSYGVTFSSAAAALNKASSWDKVGTLNWGFTNGSAKAEQGFVNALAALTRPINDVLAFILAEGDADIVDIAENIIGMLNLDINTSSGDTKIKITLKEGILRIFTENQAATNGALNHIKIELIPILEELREMDIKGANAYESAIIPLLEAFMCDGVKTYNEYVKDYNKAKDNLVIDILNPLLGFVDDVLEAPFDTLTKVLPNLAYFIDNNGISQVVNNLLAPITQELLGVLDKYGYNVDDIIKTIAGKDLGQILSEALGMDINLRLSDLNSFNVQELILPIVNSILDEKFGITLPDFDWATLASHGTLKEVKSALAGGKNYQVIADQGEVLVAVLRYLEKAIVDNIAAITKLVNGIDKIKNNEKLANILNSIFAQIATAKEDELVKAVFYILVAQPQNKFFDYTGFKTKDYDFSYPETVDVEFLTILGPMLDGLVGGLADLNSLVGGLIYKDSIISSLAVGLYGAIEGVKVGNDTLTNLLAKTDIDFTTDNVASLLMNKDYGETFPSAAKTIKAAGSWSKVNKDSLSWGVTDRDSFVHALCAALRPLYGVLDVLLNDASLGLFNIIYLPGSDGYTSTIVPLMEALGLYNIKTQYQYRQDMSKEYDAILLDIINPLLDKVEDILNAPLEVLASMLPNLALFFANDGVLQIVENLITPVSALLDALEPIVEVNDLLKALNVDISKILQKTGIVGGSYKFDIYDIAGSLKPIIGADNIVGVINKVLKLIKIKGTPLGIELMPIDWYKLASHGEVIRNEASQAATIGGRVYVKADTAELLIAVLRYLVETINYKDNFNIISNLIGGLLGGNDSISDVVNQVLGMLTGDTDQVISDLCELLQTLA